MSAFRFLLLIGQRCGRTHEAESPQTIRKSLGSATTRTIEEGDINRGKRRFSTTALQVRD